MIRAVKVKLVISPIKLVATINKQTVLIVPNKAENPKFNILLPFSLNSIN
tara:strand:- start:2881 stop:3030 length:150 start_codon:yes stop_codon:yes gene_type:complete